MKYKHLVRKDTKEYVSLLRIDGITSAFTCSSPSMILNNNPDEEIFDYLNHENPEIDFSDYELISIDIIESTKLDAIGDDIRNKLTSIKNLIALLALNNKTNDETIKNKLVELIEVEINNSKTSIDYLTNIL